MLNFIISPSCQLHLQPLKADIFIAIINFTTNLNLNSLSVYNQWKSCTLLLALLRWGGGLFVKDYFTIDTTSIAIMSLFIISGVLNPEEGFAGFNHPATITLGWMFVISAAIFKSGLIDGLSSKIIRIAKINYLLALIVFCLSAATFSAFINDFLKIGTPLNFIIWIAASFIIPLFFPFDL